MFRQVTVMRPAIGILGLLLLAACHTQLVAPYDDQFVKDAVTLQTDFDMMVETLKNPPPGTKLSYDANKFAYNKINTDLKVLETQARAHQNNDIMIKEVGIVAQQIKEVEAKHRDMKQLSPEYLDEKSQTVDQQIGILIRSEIDKKALN